MNIQFFLKKVFSYGPRAKNWMFVGPTQHYYGSTNTTKSSEATVLLLLCNSSSSCLSCLVAGRFSSPSTSFSKVFLLCKWELVWKLPKRPVLLTWWVLSSDSHHLFVFFSLLGACLIPPWHVVMTRHFHSREEKNMITLFPRQGR